MPSSKSIITKQEAEEIAMPFSPVAISSQTSKEAIKYAEAKDKGNDFRIDKLVSQITGIDEIERRGRQREIEQEAIKQSKDIQEAAYKEAYDLGFEEGKKEAYDSEKERIQSEIENLNLLITELKNLKSNLFKDNRTHIINLCYYFAKRLMMKECTEKEDYIVDVIQKTLEMAQSEEQVTIRISPDDAKFILDNKPEIFKNLGLKESTKIEEDIDLKRGGVVVETNYGVIDASIDQRLTKMADILDQESQT